GLPHREVARLHAALREPVLPVQTSQGRRLLNCLGCRAARVVELPENRPQSLLLRSFDNKRSTSRYSQMSVTRRLKPPYHSMYFGTPCRTPRSMKSKSRIRFSAAMTTTNNENPIPSQPVSWMNGTRTAQNDSTRSTR